MFSLPVPSAPPASSYINFIEARKRKLYTKNQLLMKISDGEIILFNDKRRSTRSKTINRSWKCERCKINDAVLTHHMNQNYMDNRPNNLLRICTPCHDAIHRVLPRGIHLYKLTRGKPAFPSFKKFYFAKLVKTKLEYGDAETYFERIEQEL